MEENKMKETSWEIWEQMEITLKLITDKLCEHKKSSQDKVKYKEINGHVGNIK